MTHTFADLGIGEGAGLLWLFPAPARGRPEGPARGRRMIAGR
ncbi:hypothetical protein [Xanthobacter sp. VNH20]